MSVDIRNAKTDGKNIIATDTALPITMKNAPADAWSVPEVESDGGIVSQRMVPGKHLTYTANLNTGNINTEKAFMLISLANDTENWKHDANSTHFDLEYVRIMVNPDSTYRGGIHVGIVTETDAANGSIQQIIDIDVSRQASVMDLNFDFGGSMNKFRAAIDAGVADYIFGEVESGNAIFASGANLVGPDGQNYNPAVGDLVLWVTRSADTVGINISVGYSVTGT